MLNPSHGIGRLVPEIRDLALRRVSRLVQNGFPGVCFQSTATISVPCSRPPLFCSGVKAMFGFAPRNLRDCERVTRRGLLQIGSLTGLGLSLPTLLAAKTAMATRRATCSRWWQT